MHNLDASVIVGALSVIGLLVIWAGKKAFPILRAAVHLAELIVGKPAEGKIDRIPGLNERLAINDQRLANIEYELRTNSGGSLRDLVVETKNLALQNVADAHEAKQKAEQAAARASEVADALATSETTAKNERLLMQEAIEGLCNGLEDFAQEVHAKDMGTQRALRAAGFPISEIVEGEL